MKTTSVMTVCLIVLSALFMLPGIATAQCAKGPNGFEGNQLDPDQLLQMLTMEVDDKLKNPLTGVRRWVGENQFSLINTTSLSPSFHNVDNDGDTIPDSDMFSLLAAIVGVNGGVDGEPPLTAYTGISQANLDAIRTAFQTNVNNLRQQEITIQGLELSANITAPANGSITNGRMDVVTKQRMRLHYTALFGLVTGDLDLDVPPLFTDSVINNPYDNTVGTTVENSIIDGISPVLRETLINVGAMYMTVGNSAQITYIQNLMGCLLNNIVQSYLTDLIQSLDGVVNPTVTFSGALPASIYNYGTGGDMTVNATLTGDVSGTIQMILRRTTLDDTITRFRAKFLCGARDDADSRLRNYTAVATFTNLQTLCFSAEARSWLNSATITVTRPYHCYTALRNYTNSCQNALLAAANVGPNGGATILTSWNTWRPNREGFLIAEGITSPPLRFASHPTDKGVPIGATVNLGSGVSVVGGSGARNYEWWWFDRLGCKQFMTDTCDNNDNEKCGEPFEDDPDFGIVNVMAMAPSTGNFDFNLVNVQRQEGANNQALTTPNYPCNDSTDVPDAVNPVTNQPGVCAPINTASCDLLYTQNQGNEGNYALTICDSLWRRTSHMMELTVSGTAQFVTVTGLVVNTATRLTVTLNANGGGGLPLNATYRAIPTNWTVSGTSLGSLSPNPTSVTMLSNTSFQLNWTSGSLCAGGNLTVVAGGSIVDALGFPLGADNLETVTGVAVGAAAPTVLNITPACSSTVTVPTTVVVNFSQVVSNVVPVTLSVGGSAATTVTGTGAGPYTFSGFAAPAPGVISLVLDQGSITNASNCKLAAGINCTFTGNTGGTNPTVVLSGAASGCAAGLVTATFDQAVTGVTAGDFTLTNATAGTFTAVSTTVYTLAFTATGAAVTANMAAGVATGTVGGLPNLVSNTYNYTADLTNPSVVMSGAASGCAAGTVTATFSEPVTGVLAGDFVLANATAGLFTPVSTTVYTLTFTATGAAVTVNMAAAAANDACARPSTAATQYNYTADLVAPTVVLSYPGGTITGPTTVTITFSEAVTGLLVTEVTASTGTISALAGGPTVYTVTLTPPGAGSGNINVNLAAAMAQDACTLNNTAATQLVVPYTIPTNPTVVLTGAASGCAAGIVTATFSEPVTGVVAGDIVLTNATGGTFTAVSTTVYTRAFTATAAAVTASVPAGAANAVTGGLPNTVSNTYNYTADLTNPTVTLTGAASGCAAGLVTATFSEAVTGVAAGDFVLVNATAGTFTAVSTTVYTLAFTSTGTAVTVNMAAAAAADACARPSTAAVQYSYTADVTPPSVVLSGPASGCATGATVTATFSEPVTGVAIGDFVLGNATAGTFTAVSTTVYTLSFTATAGAVTINMAAGAATDAGACNTSTAAAVYNYAADFTNPGVVLSGAASGCATGTVTATFSEPVTGVLAGDFVLANATAGTFTAVSTTVYTLGFTATGAAVTVDMAAAAATDACTRPSTAATQYNYAADVVNPTVVLSGAASGCAAGLVTATFSEAVTGIAAGDFLLTNATAGTFTAVSTTVYTLSFTSTGTAVSVNMAAAAGADLCARPSVAATPYSYTADVTNPSVVLSGTASGCAAGLVTATFSEAVTGVLANDFVLVNATAGTFTAVSTTVYTLAFTSTGAAVTVNMAAAAATDACARPSTAAAVYNYAADLTGPTVALSYPGGTINGATTVTATFSDNVTGLLVGEIVASGAPGSTITALAGGPAVYTVTLTPPGSGSGTININLAAASAQDACGNNNTAATQLAVPYNIPTNPTVVLTGAASGCAAGLVTATFNQPVNGVVAGDFTLTNATAGTFTAVSTTVYTLAFTSTGAAVTANMAAGVANAITGGLPNIVSNTYNYTADLTNPTVVLSGAASGCAAGLVTATFSEPVTGVLAGDFVFTNATGGAFTAVSTTVYTRAFTSTGAAVSVNMAAAAAADACALPSVAATAYNYSADISVPSVVLSGAASGCAAGTVTATFSEAVSGVAAGDFVLANATAGTFTTVSATVYTLAFTATGAAVTVNMAAGAATDGCNNSTAAAVYNYTADLTNPTVVLSGVASGCAAGTVTATFSEAVTGVVVGDFVLTNATAGTFNPVSATVYTLDFTATGAAVTVNMAAAAAADLCARPSTAAAQYNYAADLTAPTVVLSGAASGCAAGTVTATFNQAVTGVAAGDFVLANATAGTFTAVSTTVYTLAFTATGGAVSVNMAAGAATDGCNTSAAAATYNYTADLTAPTVTLTGAASGCAAGLVTATFSEAVTGVAAGDFVLANATAGTFTAVSTTVYTLAFTSTGTAVTVNMAAGAANDACAQASTAATQYSYTADVTNPTVVLSGAASGCAAGLVTATFSESVTGVAAGDFVLANATAGTFTAVSTTVYTLAFTSTGAAVTVNMAAGAANDACARPSTAAAQYNYAANVSVPSVALSYPGGTVSGAFTLTVTFSEAVSGLLVTEIVATGAAGTTVTALSGGPAIYTVTVTPPLAGGGTINLNVAANVADDGCNNNTAALQLNVPYLNNTNPNVVLSGAASGCAAGTVTATFDEAVTGVAAGDFALTNATAGTFTAVSTTVYTLTFTSTAAAVSVNMAAGAANATVGGLPSNVSNTYNYTADVTNPTVVLSGAASGCAAGLVTATFSEAVTGVAAGDFVLANATAGAFTAVSTTVYTLAFTSTGTAVSVNMAAAAATDACARPSVAATAYSYTADVSAPTVVLSGSASGCASGMVTATFSEAVTGVIASDIALANATAGVFTAVSATVYTLTFTATGAAVVADMAAGVATDGCNGNVAAAAYNYAADVSVPSVILSGAASGCAAGTVTATFSETVTGVAAGDFGLVNATAGTFTQVSGTVYTLSFTATASPVTVDMAAGVANDACGNANTAAASYVYTPDVSQPSVVLSYAGGTVGGPFTLTATFSENVTGLAVGEIVAVSTPGSTVTALAGGPTVYTVTVTPPVSSAGNININLAALSAADACSNGNTAATQLVVPFVTGSNPTVTLTGAASGCISDGVVTATFSEPVTGVTSGDFLLTNAIAGTFTAVSTSVYTLAFTATSQSVSVNMAAGAADSISASLPNVVAAAYNYSADLAAPSVVLSYAGGTVSGAFTLTATFDEDVSNLTLAGFTASLGTLGTLAGGPSVYTVIVTPPSNSTGTINLNMAAGVAQDACNNDNTAATQLAVPFDTTVVTAITFTQPTAQTVTEGSGAAALVTFTVAPVSGGTPGYTYQWFFNGGAVPANATGELTDTLTITVATQLDNQGDYHVEITDTTTPTPQVASSIPVTLTVNISSGVPALGLLGLGALATVLAAVGAATTRRRKK